MRLLDSVSHFVPRRPRVSVVQLGVQLTLVTTRLLPSAQQERLLRLQVAAPWDGTPVFLLLALLAAPTVILVRHHLVVVVYHLVPRRVTFHAPMLAIVAIPAPQPASFQEVPIPVSQRYLPAVMDAHHQLFIAESLVAWEHRRMELGVVALLG